MVSHRSCRAIRLPFDASICRQSCLHNIADVIAMTMTTRIVVVKHVLHVEALLRELHRCFSWCHRLRSFGMWSPPSPMYCELIGDRAVGRGDYDSSSLQLSYQNALFSHTLTVTIELCSGPGDFIPSTEDFTGISLPVLCLFIFLSFAGHFAIRTINTND